MDKKKSRDIQDLWMIGAQIVVLALGFFSAFSWEAEIEPKIFLMTILTIVVLQYPMHDRLRNVLGNELMEARKGIHVTQIMLMDLRRGLDIEHKAAEDEGRDLVQQAERMADELQGIQRSFDEAFEGARRGAGEFWIDSLVNTIGVVVYLGIVIGVAALVGWLANIAI